MKQLYRAHVSYQIWYSCKVWMDFYSFHGVQLETSGTELSLHIWGSISNMSLPHVCIFGITQRAFSEMILYLSPLSTGERQCWL